jgi:hypothetical protein
VARHSLEVADGQNLEAQVARGMKKKKVSPIRSVLHMEANRRNVLLKDLTHWERKATTIATNIATISLFRLFKFPQVFAKITSGARALSTLCRIELIGEGLRSLVCLSVVVEDQKPVSTVFVR